MARFLRFSHRRRHRLLLVGINLQSYSLIERHTQEVIDDLKTQGPIRVVDAANVAQYREAAVGIIPQKNQNPGQGFAHDAAAQLAGDDLANGLIELRVRIRVAGKYCSAWRDHRDVSGDQRRHTEPAFTLSVGTVGKPIEAVGIDRQ